MAAASSREESPVIVELQESSSEDDNPSEQLPSLLDRLRSPTPSDLARKRKVPCNPPKGAKKGKGKVAAEPMKVTASDRLKEFPGQHLCLESGKLFCKACREPLSLKKSVIKLHIKSVKNSSGIERFKSKATEEQNILDMLKKYDTTVHPVGEKLPERVRIHRLKVLRCFLESGVPLNKADCFREILEESSYRLCSSQHLREMIPIIRNQEDDKVRNGIRDRNVSVVFDGTTHVCEAMVVVVVRFIDDEWNIQQRVVCLMLLAKSLSGEEVARQLIVVLGQEFAVTGNRLIASMHDRASVNNVAMQTLQILYPNVIDVGCFSHTLDLVGEKFHTPILDKFFKAWIAMFSRSTKKKLAWKTKTGLPVPRYSVTRWWSNRKC